MAESASKLPDDKWTVTASQKAAFDKFFLVIWQLKLMTWSSFQAADKDKDGYVTGSEVRGIFGSSKLPTGTLAQIWALCDIFETGKLNAEQFALAMALIAQTVKVNEKKPFPFDIYV